MSRSRILDELVIPGTTILFNGVDLASISRIIQLLRQYDREYITGTLSPLEALECLLEYRKNGLKLANERNAGISALEAQNACLLKRLNAVADAVDFGKEVPQ